LVKKPAQEENWSGFLEMAGKRYFFRSIPVGKKMKIKKIRDHYPYQLNKKYQQMQIAQEVKISDNGFVFNSKTGDSFNLNPTALELIKMIAEGKDFEAIQQYFLQKYEVDELSFEKDFYEFCALLKQHEITIESSNIHFD